MSPNINWPFCMTLLSILAMFFRIVLQSMTSDLYWLWDCIFNFILQLRQQELVEESIQRRESPGRLNQQPLQIADMS